MEFDEMPVDRKERNIKNIKDFIDDIEKKPISHITFKEKASELNGIVLGTRTTMNALATDIKKIREEFEPSLKAVREDCKRKHIDLGKIEPLGDIFVMQLQYIEKMRNLYGVQHYMIKLLLDWDRQLESALESAQGFAHSSEVLEKTEKFMDKCLEMGVKTTTENQKAFFTENRKAMEDMAYNIRLQTETLKKLTRLISDMSNGKKAKPEPDDSYDDDESNEQEDDSFEPVETPSNELDEEDKKTIRAMSRKQPVWDYVVKKYPDWPMEKIREELEKKFGMRIQARKDCLAYYKKARINNGLE